MSDEQKRREELIAKVLRCLTGTGEPYYLIDLIRDVTAPLETKYKEAEDLWREETLKQTERAEKAETDLATAQLEKDELRRMAGDWNLQAPTELKEALRQETEERIHLQEDLNQFVEQVRAEERRRVEKNE